MQYFSTDKNAQSEAIQRVLMSQYHRVSYMGLQVTKEPTRPSVVPRKVMSQRRHIAAKAKCKHEQNVKRAAVNKEEKRVVIGASL